MKNENVNVNMNELTQRTYVYMYRIMENCDYETIYENGVPMHLTEKELVELAAGWKKGLYKNPIDTRDLPKTLSKRLDAAIREQCARFVEEEGYDYDDLTPFIDMRPMELLLAVNAINGVSFDYDYLYEYDPFAEHDEETVEMDIPYTVRHDGLIHIGTCPCALRITIANIMERIIKEKPTDINEFNYMKQVAPLSYGFVRTDILGWCHKEHKEWGNDFELILNEFPTEIHEESSEY